MDVIIISYKCECENNWTGKDCDILDKCMGLTCNNKGMCIPIGKDQYVCSCFTGFSGKK